MIEKDKPIRVLIVDDHEVVRIGLKTLLTRNPAIVVVGEADSVASAESELLRLKPDLVLLDVRLPDGDGFTLCRKVQALNLDTRVLILTSSADDDTVYESMKAGADGYLLKEIDADKLVRAIIDVFAGLSIIDPSVTKRVIGRAKSASLSSGTGKQPVLSPQEIRVLALVAEGKTNKEIATELELSDKTVKNYLSNVLEKLQVGRRSQAAVYFAKHLAK